IMTSPIIYGEKETEGQHSFHQLLMQGTHHIACDFIGVLKHLDAEQDQPLLLSHCLAQSRSLMLGKTEEEAYAILVQQGLTQEAAKTLAPHKVVKGNQPSTTIIIPELNAKALGYLLALYEHKTFVEGVLWQINSFDQYGVELGKVIANDIALRLQGD